MTPFEESWLEKPEYREKVCELAEGFETLVEVGVMHGKLSQMLACVPGVMELHLVDPWSLDWADGSIKAEAIASGGAYQLRKNPLVRVKLAPHEYMDVMAAKVEHWAKSVNTPCITVHRMTSVEAAVVLPDDLDFVHIDANHKYENIRDDILAWLPKMAPGGRICGDDYNQEGVRRAVDELIPCCRIIGKRIWTYDVP